MRATRNGVAITVSIVEDHAEVRQLLTEWISQARGFTSCSQYANGESAISRLPEDNPAVVLMDISLPDLSGIECVRRLRPVMPQTQFVVLTGCGDSNHIFDALAAGAVGYMLKQTSRDELIDSLRQVMTGGSPMSGCIARKVVQFFQQNRSVKPPAPEVAEVEELSARERQVLELLARGYLYKEITESLSINICTVNAHARKIYEKLQVHSRTQAVVKFLEFQRRTASPAGYRSRVDHSV